MSLEGVNGILNVESAALHAPQVGVANTNPQHILSVGSNLYVSGDSSDVLTVDGNVVCEGVKVGLIEIIPSYDLEAVANVGNSTSNTIQFTNPDTGIVTTGNVSVGKDLNVTGNLNVLGTTTTIDTENLRVKDPIIELGKDNDGSLVDLGLVMTRPSGSSNVAVIFDEDTDTLEIGYTQNNASDTDIAMRTAAIEPLSVNVNGNLSVTSNVEVGTANLFVDTTTGNVGIGKTDPGSALDIYKEDTTAAGQTVISSITGVFSGSDATGGNINNKGLLINLDSSATGGTATNLEEHRVWGIEVDIDVTGDSDDIKGGRFLVRSSMTENGTDRNTNIYGIDAQGQHNGTGLCTNIIGVNARSFKGTSSTGFTDTMIGVQAEYEINAGTCTDAYAVRARFDRNGGAVSNSYIFYGDHIGSTTTITNNYGLYVTDVDKHYLEGNVGIGTDNPLSKLTIGNTVTSGKGLVLYKGSDNSIKIGDYLNIGHTLKSNFPFISINADYDQTESQGSGFSGDNTWTPIYSASSASMMVIDVNGGGQGSLTFNTLAHGASGGSKALSDMNPLLHLDAINTRVGIGTDNPDSKLQVYDDTNTRSLLTVREGSGTAARTEINTGIRFDTYSVESYAAGGSSSANRDYHIRFNNGRKMALYYDGDDLAFWWGGGGTYVARASVGQSAEFGFTFTGQHRNFIKDISYKEVIEKELGGLIVCANNNEYVKISNGIAKGSNAITQNEALPIVSLSSKACDKSCFGVISESEDPNSNRGGSLGMFKSYYDTEDGDKRIIINSVGEGAIWVTNINGSLESGDYITTSNVAGYGQKQDSDSLKNYTVAKITMDCDFQPVTQPVQIIKKEMGDVNYWVKTTYENVTEEEYSNLTDENRRTITETAYTNEDGEIFPEQNEQSTYTELEQTTYQKITVEESKTEREGYELEVRQELVNVLDEHGQLQWEDDPSGATEKAYKIRYLDADGNITDEANAVHKAAFVGCTYHCG
jgi:hypothetical protein